MRTNNTGSRRGRKRFRPEVVPIEDRCLLSIIVGNTNDSGTDSLRADAVYAAAEYASTGVVDQVIIPNELGSIDLNSPIAIGAGVDVEAQSLAGAKIVASPQGAFVVTGNVTLGGITLVAGAWPQPTAAAITVQSGALELDNSLVQYFPRGIAVQPGASLVLGGYDSLQDNNTAAITNAGTITTTTGAAPSFVGNGIGILTTSTGSTSLGGDPSFYLNRPALVNEGGVLSVTGGQFVDNDAPILGSGASVQSTWGTTTIDGAIFQGGEGGPTIAITGSRVTLSGDTFSEVFAGAMLFDNAVATVMNCSVTGSSALNASLVAFSGGQTVFNGNSLTLDDATNGSFLYVNLQNNPGAALNAQNNTFADSSSVPTALPNYIDVVNANPGQLTLANNRGPDGLLNDSPSTSNTTTTVHHRKKHVNSHVHHGKHEPAGQHHRRRPKVPADRCVIRNRRRVRNDIARDGKTQTRRRVRSAPIRLFKAGSNLQDGDLS